MHDARQPSRQNRTGNFTSKKARVLLLSPSAQWHESECGLAYGSGFLLPVPGFLRLLACRNRHNRPRASESGHEPKGKKEAPRKKRPCRSLVSLAKKIKKVEKSISFLMVCYSSKLAEDKFAFCVLALFFFVIGYLGQHPRRTPTGPLSLFLFPPLSPTTQLSQSRKKGSFVVGSIDRSCRVGGVHRDPHNATSRWTCLWNVTNLTGHTLHFAICLSK